VYNPTTENGHVPRNGTNIQSRVTLPGSKAFNALTGQITSGLCRYIYSTAANFTLFAVLSEVGSQSDAVQRSVAGGELLITNLLCVGILNIVTSND
jgi:hypothetical protein